MLYTMLQNNGLKVIKCHTNIFFLLRNGKLVDASPEIINERKSEIEKLNAQYGGDKGVDMTQFPQFKFEGT